MDSFANRAGTLWVRTIPGEPHTFELYDGSKVGQDFGEAGLSLTWSAGDLFDDGAIFELPHVIEPLSVDGADPAEDLDGVASGGGWAWEDGTLWIRVDDEVVVTW